MLKDGKDSEIFRIQKNARLPIITKINIFFFFFVTLLKIPKRCSTEKTIDVTKKKNNIN